jgi:hypothetical protein
VTFFLGSCFIERMDSGERLRARRKERERDEEGDNKRARLSKIQFFTLHTKEISNSKSVPARRRKKRTGGKRRNEMVREKHKSARENAHPSAAAAERGQAAEKSSSGW